MFRNLVAEQARHGHTNAFVAKYLGVSKSGYEAKKRTGNFKVSEGAALMRLYSADFNYLFAVDENPGQGKAG